MFSTTNERATHRRWNRIYFAIAAIVLVIAILPSIHVARWGGYARRNVIVAVVDAGSAAGIPEAHVTIFQGFSEVFAGMPRPSPDEQDPRTQTIDTNAAGQAEFEYRFNASGATSWFSETGNVRLGDRWIDVSADGYETALVRIGEQTGESRDIHDKSPVRVKIELQKLNIGR